MEISKSDYIKALKADGVLNERRKAVLKSIYTSPAHEACPAMIEQKTDVNIRQVNLVFGSLAKAVAQELNIERNTENFPYDQWWLLLATGREEPEGYYWKLNVEFVKAIEEMKLFQ
ncbi:MAG: hypothetical protein QM725_03445 [Lacibacter sp.]